MHRHSHHPHDHHPHCAERDERHGRGGPHEHGPGRGRRRHGGGGEGGRRARLFEQGDLRLIILMLIAEKPRHGYEIIRAIEDMVDGAYTPSPGTIYPTLTLLEDIGHTAVTQGENGRRLNQITAEGGAYLEANQPAVDALRARLSQIRETQPPGPPPQVLRATENFNLALRMRLARQPLTEEQATAIAAVIDAAAVGVERS